MESLKPRRISFAKDPAYWQALGEFIESYARIEGLLFFYLNALTNLDHPLGVALLSGVHADQIIDLIRRVWAVKPPEPVVRETLEAAFAQVKLINSVRNSMVHFASFVTDDTGRVTSNVARALTKDHIREFRVSPDVLGQLLSDLHKIADHLLYGISEYAEAATRDDIRGELSALNAAWRYKPPEDHLAPAKKPGRPDRKRGQVPSPRPESSQA